VPVNYEQIHRQVKIMGENAPAHFKSLAAKEKKASDLYTKVSAKPEDVKHLVEQYRTSHPGYRCAMPSEEGMLQTFPPPQSPPRYILLAADGSQITPSHHEAVEFGVVNIGVLRFSSTEPAREITQSDLLYYETIESANGLVDDEFIALKRDLQERQLLLQLAALEKQSVITLTDGPLEIFGEPKAKPEFASLFAEYLLALHHLAELKTATAGYVDKPRADLVVRMLELTLLSSDELSLPGLERKLSGVTDSNIFQKFLSPGERSAIFGIQSLSSEKFSGELSLHFFYINVGRKDHPVLARVEIPAWVTNNWELVNLVHGVLWEQNTMMGTRPYPYALHRAHEIAVVKYEEKEHISAMIEAELLKHDITRLDKSNKQSAKDLPGKKRYGE